MKVTIGYYEAEIEVKNSLYKSKDATGALLNQIALWCYEASRQYRRDGYDALSASARESGIQIFNTLKAKGYFKDLYNSEE